jgi:hypothetical protein
VQAAEDPFVSRMEIFTLNHDLLIERALEHAGIYFANGFVPVSADLRSWDIESFAKSREKVRLTKLHGSIDWYTRPILDRGPSCVCIATNRDVNHALGPDGSSALIYDSEILIGTFNKMTEYTMGIYADLFCAFRKALWALDKLVVSGYSFGDKGINASFVEWTRQKGERRTLIVAPHASRYRHEARGAIRKLFADCDVQLTTLDAKFKDVTWERIRAWCGNGS